MAVDKIKRPPVTMAKLFGTHDGRIPSKGAELWATSSMFNEMMLRQNKYALENNLKKVPKVRKILVGGEVLFCTFDEFVDVTGHDEDDLFELIRTMQIPVFDLGGKNGIRIPMGFIDVVFGAESGEITRKILESRKEKEVVSIYSGSTVKKALPKPKQVDRPFMPKYPWQKWFNGRIWILENGKDFKTNDLKNWINTARSAARKHGVKIHVNVIKDTNKVRVQAYVPARSHASVTKR